MKSIATALVVVGMLLFGAAALSRPPDLLEGFGGSSVFVRGSYGGSPETLQTVGFNTVNVMPYRSNLDRLQARGLKGVVWLWGYRNRRCRFARTETALRPVIEAIAGHPAIRAYQIADEPSAAQCPTAPRAMRRRHRFVKSIDSTKDTYLVVSTWNGVKGFPYEDFAGKSDVMGLDVYPCAHYRWEYPNNSNPPCKFEDIRRAAAQAEDDGVSRYWAVVQGFADSWHRMPSREELAEQFNRWDASRMEGYFVFTHGGHGVTGYGSDLSLRLEVALQNRRQF